MIDIVRDGSKMVVQIKHGLTDDGSYLALKWEAGQDYLAEALLRHIRKNLYETIETIRRLEYESGWRDAKSKRTAKKTWFRCTFMKAAS